MDPLPSQAPPQTPPQAPPQVDLLKVEYLRWYGLHQYIKQIFDILGLQIPNSNSKLSRNQRELANALSRYFITLTNNQSIANDIMDKLIGELTDHKLIKPHQVNTVRNIIHQSYDIPGDIPPPSFSQSPNNIIIQYGVPGGEYVTSMSIKRYSMLVNHVRSTGLNDDQIVIGMTRMLLCYDSYFPLSGTFWSVPPKVYHYLREKYNVAAECFSSPLNYTLIPYCSMFYDTDSMFGSIGDFFQNWPNFAPGSYVINPPFVELIINDMAGTVLAMLDKGGMAGEGGSSSGSGDRGGGGYTFFILLPDWGGLDGYEQLKASFYVKALIQLDKNTYKVYSATDDKYIKGGFRGMFLVLSNDPITLNIREILASFN